MLQHKQHIIEFLFGYATVLGTTYQVDDVDDEKFAIVKYVVGIFDAEDETKLMNSAT